jgi:ABC-type branched-subunit amino acid transport system substrate-binding protein
MPGDAAPVVKIGLIAPFEGAGRPLGYAVLPAVKIALAEANTSGELGRYRVALVALNDDLGPRSAADQAKALAQDPDVLAALGPWSRETIATAAPLLSQAGIPALVAAPLANPPAGVFSLCPSTPEPETSLLTENGFLVGLAAEGTRAPLCAPVAEPPAGFAAAYQARTGATPGPDAFLAYAGARAILQALARDVAAAGRPTRGGVTAALGAYPVETRLVWYRVENGRWVK